MGNAKVQLRHFENFSRYFEKPEKVNEIAILISVLRRLKEYKIPRTFLSKIISIERRNVPRLRNFFSSRNLFPDITAPNHTCLLADRKSHEMS